MVLSTERESFFEVEERKLLSNDQEVSIKYIRKTDDSTKFDSQLAAGLSFLLAAELAYNMTKSTSLQESYKAQGDDKIAKAKASDSLEGKTPDRRSNRWLGAKYR